MDTIIFSLGVTCSLIPCTIPLTGALPTVTQDLTINGSATIISGVNSFRVFDLGAVTVNISNLSIANGNVSGNGGAIRMSNDMNIQGTTLTLTNVFLSNNHANLGGAIYEPRGTLTVTNSNFSGNGAGNRGGAIYHEGDNLVVVDSTFSSNTANNIGGAIANGSFFTTISGSTFSSNSAVVGGAIASFFILGGMQLNDSVFYNNAATGTDSSAGGGAIFTFGGDTLTNVTLSGNSAKNNGGGMLVDNQALAVLNNVTITDNTADSDNDEVGDGGGIFSGFGSFRVQNSIIAGNRDTPGNAGAGVKKPDCSGLFTIQGYNLIGINDGCNGFVDGVNGDQVGTAASPIDPMLEALADNGGPTLTHALALNSPAINAGDPLPAGSGSFACAASDQRGVARPQRSVCDMGAFELEFLSLYLPLILR
jgi:predicted outer membrane repeat protein